MKKPLSSGAFFWKYIFDSLRPICGPLFPLGARKLIVEMASCFRTKDVTRFFCLRLSLFATLMPPPIPPFNEVLSMLRIVFFSFLVLLLARPVLAADWELALDRHEIRVWTRVIPDYPIREIRAETTVKSTLNGLVALLMDTDKAASWIYRTDRIDLLKRDDASGSFLIHVMTDFPWPLTDRDAVVDGRITQDAGSGIISVSSRAVFANAYPPAKDFVRMPDMEGTWIFQPLDQGQVKVVMTMRANPGGNIPAAVINLIIHETPYRTLRGLRKVIAEARYQNARMPQIREP